MKSKPPKVRMQERGYKALTTFIKEVTYHALRRYAKDTEVAHSKYIRDLIEADLRKKGYLPTAPSPPSPRSKP
jgi:hypothetical protein